MSFTYAAGDNNGVPHITFSQLKQHAEGIICLSGGPKGPLGKAILENKSADASSFVLLLKQVFGGRFYMEIMRHGEEVEAKTEDAFLKLAYDHNIPLVATNEAFFATPELFEAHDALLCISEGRYVSEVDRRKVTPQHYFKTAEEMAKLFEDLPEAITNTAVIAQRCSYMPMPHKPLLPNFPCEGTRSEAEELEAQLKKVLESA